MKRYPASLIFALWLSIPLAVVAQKDTSSILDVLRTEYETAMAELELPLAEWNTRYRTELQKLEPAVRAKGDLEQMLAIRKEIENLDQPIQQDIAPEHRELARLREVYDNRAAQIRKASDLKAKQLHSTYQIKLKALQTELTKVSKIDEAMLVREALATLSAVGPGLAGSPVAVSGNRSPGKLIVGGEYYNGEPILISPEMQAKRYVRVFSGNARWYALTAEGQLELAPGGAGAFKIPEGAKPFVDLRCAKSYPLWNPRRRNVHRLGRTPGEGSRCRKCHQGQTHRARAPRGCPRANRWHRAHHRLSLRAIRLDVQGPSGHAAQRRPGCCQRKLRVHHQAGPYAHGGKLSVRRTQRFISCRT